MRDLNVFSDNKTIGFIWIVRLNTMNMLLALVYVLNLHIAADESQQMTFILLFAENRVIQSNPFWFDELNNISNSVYIEKIN